MESKSKNILQKIIQIILVLILFLSTILIGLPQENNISIINILIAIAAILSIINNRKEKHLKITITDIFLTLLAISACIPLILNNYVSLNNTVNYILRYTSVFLIYFTIRKEAENNSKLENCIINTIIASAIFLILCGIELMTTKYLEPIVESIIGPSRIFTYEIRMSSLITYPNAFAIYMSMVLFLVLGKLEQSKNNKLNTFYLATIMWLFIGIISSESRLTFACLAVVLLLYLIINKNNLYNNLKNLIINGILAIIFTAIYFKLISLGLYLAIWGLVVLYTIISAIINYFQQKMPEIKLKINLKIILISLFAIIILVVLLLNIKADLVLFKGQNAQNTIRKTVCKIDNTKDYTFKLEIEAKSDIKDNFTISIIEQDEKYTDINETSITLDNFTGTKEIKITPLEETKYSRIYFKSKENNKNTELRIKALYVNDKEIIINYKFLPSDLITKIFSSGLTSNNIVERVGFLKSAIIGGIDNNLLGIGGGGWQYIHAKYQDYNSLITEVHSYIGQIFVELGLIGFVSYLGIIISLIVKCIKFIKTKNKELVGIMCAILVLILHSILDFEMSYFLIMLVVYILIAILTTKINDNSKFNINKIAVIICATIIIAPNIIINSNALYSRAYFEPKIINTSTSFTEKINLQAANVKLNPYNLKYQTTYIKSWQIYRTSLQDISAEDNINFIITTNNLIEKLYKNEPLYQDTEIFNIFKVNTIQLIKNGDTENCERYIKLIYEIYTNIGVTNKYRAFLLIQQLNELSEFTYQLNELNENEWADKFEILKNQKTKTIIEQIKQYKKCNITKQESEDYLRMLNYEE